MSPALDALSLKFAILTRNTNATALDVGCGDGIATAAALARGGHVLAVDPDAEALRRVLVRVPSQHYSRLQVQVGVLPTLDFKRAHFPAVHAARVLHLLTPSDLEVTLRKFFRWLYPRGKLFLSAFTPAGRFWRRFHSEYVRRRMARERWPGYIAARSIHLIDSDVLTREVRAAGFTIEEVRCYPLPWDSEQVCCACVARCA
jgi:ubiquinone/menaquinone biosynthesis C-methylase UbiE